MIEIIPSILVKTKEEFQEIYKKLSPFTLKIHFDIADGILVPNTTVKGIEEAREMVGKNVTAHLMVQNPAEIINEWLELDNVKTITFHIEAADNHEEIIDNIKQHGKTVGLAINPDTDIQKLEKLADKIDLAHFMTVHPGFYGGEFVDSVVENIRKFHSKYPNLPITVDGGVIPERVPKLVEAGATVLISGSYILKSHSPEEAMAELKKYV